MLVASLEQLLSLSVAGAASISRASERLGMLEPPNLKLIIFAS